VSPLFAARAVSAGRLLIGALMMVSPPKAMGAWIGAEEAERPATDLITRSFGAREVLLGFLGLHVADRPGVGPRTLQSFAFMDATDLTVTLARRESLPGTAVPMMVALAGGAVVAQLWAARELS
jgi:hypothetical protein